MNKTISINIAGFVFNIEEHAYEKLNHYLDSIRKNFQKEPDCEEIMADIEARIAELFQEQLSDGKQVIIEKDVDSVISVMGKPEDYVSEDSVNDFSQDKSDEEAEFVEAEEVKGNEYHGRQNKRLYRDEQGGSIGGVCSGLGWFFGLDPILIRIGFILLTILGGSGVLIYVILWIVIPEAKTTAEILEMQGEPVNLGSIKDHVRGMKSDINQNAKHAKKKVKKAVDRGVRAGSRLAQSLSKIVGTGLVLGGILALIVLFIILFGDTGLLPLVGSEQVEDLMTLLDVIYPDGRSGFVFFSIIIVTLIPIVSAIFVGVKLLFDIKARFKSVTIALSIIWWIGVTVLIITGVELGMNFRNHVEVDYDVPVTVDSTNVLFVDIAEDDIFSNYIEYQQVWNYSELIRVNEERVYLGYPKLTIVEKRDSGDFEVVLYKESHGKYHKEAIHKAENIQYDIKPFENKLILAPYFSITREERMRNQKVHVEIRVPIGKKVKFGASVDRILVGVSDGYYEHNETFANTEWFVDENGFRCIACKDRRVYEENFDW